MIGVCAKKQEVWVHTYVRMTVQEHRTLRPTNALLDESVVGDDVRVLLGLCNRMYAKEQYYDEVFVAIRT